MGWWVCWVKEPPETLMCSPQAPLRGLLHCSGPRSCGGLGAAENTSRFMWYNPPAGGDCPGTGRLLQGLLLSPQGGSRPRRTQDLTPTKRERWGRERSPGHAQVSQGAEGCPGVGAKHAFALPTLISPLFFKQSNWNPLAPLEGSTEPSAMTPCPSSSLGR